MVGGDLRPCPAHEPGADDPDPDGHATVAGWRSKKSIPAVRQSSMNSYRPSSVLWRPGDAGGAAVEPELVPGGQLLGPRADVGHPLRVLVGQLVRLGEALPAGHLEVLVAHDLVGAPVELDGLRVAPDLRAALAEDLEQRRDLVREDVEVELVAVARGQTHRVVLAVAADQQLDPRGARSPRTVGQVVDPRVGPLEAEARFVQPGRPPDDLEVLGQPLHPVLEARVVVAVRGGLVVLEPGAQAERQAAAADRIERRGGLGGHRRVVERRVHDDQPDADPRHERRQPGRQRPAVEGDRLARPLGEDVLPGPDRFEPESLGGLGQLHDARPGSPGLPALELVEIALRQDQSDLHGLRARRGRCRRDACRPQVVDQLVDALVGVDQPGHAADDAVDAELDPLRPSRRHGAGGCRSRRA